MLLTGCAACLVLLVVGACLTVVLLAVAAALVPTAVEVADFWVGVCLPAVAVDC